MIGLSWSIGTNMLPGIGRSLKPASLTNSEPIPTSRPSSVDQGGAAELGVRRRGEDRVLEQVFPVAGELPPVDHVDPGRIQLADVRLTTSSGCLGCTSADTPSGIGVRSSGCSARTRPKPVS